MAAARDVRDLASVALAMVGVAFRLRLELHRRSRAVEGGDGIWGYLVVGQTPSEIEAALDSFHQAQVRLHRRNMNVVKKKEKKTERKKRSSR